MTPSERATITVLPEDLGKSMPKGTPLIAALREIGIPMNYPCAGAGRCANCRVRFDEGAPDPHPREQEHLGEDELAAGWRLACRSVLDYDARVHVPGHCRLVEPKILTASGRADFPLDPGVLKIPVNPREPTVEEPLSEHELVREILMVLRDPVPEPGLAYLRKLPDQIRKGEWHVTVTDRSGILVDVEVGDTTSSSYGVAIDLGTTTVAASLHSLRTGEELALTARMNPQVTMGEDVISRLNRTFHNRRALEELQHLITSAINGMMVRLCETANVSLESVYEIAIAGNAVMNHLLLGVPPENIGLAPYTPVFRSTPELRADQIGLEAHAEAGVVVLPNIGGFVGGDTVGGTLVCELASRDGTSLLIDIGTNCEVVLAHNGVLYATSAPAGPSLEGACIEFGMRAEPGAIDDVLIRDGDCVVTTIDRVPSRGLCGSGLVHAVAALRQEGVILPNGLIVEPKGPRAKNVPPALLRRLDVRGPRAERFLLQSRNEGGLRDVWLTQKDIREFQLARAAIVSSWKTLCEEAGIESSAITRVFVAGAFGNYIRPEAAVQIGLTPHGDHVEVSFVGNASLEGARKVLLNRDARRQAAALPARVKFVELAGRDSFDETFAMELALGG